MWKGTWLARPGKLQSRAFSEASTSSDGGDASKASNTIAVCSKLLSVVSQVAKVCYHDRGWDSRIPVVEPDEKSSILLHDVKDEWLLVDRLKSRDQRLSVEASVIKLAANAKGVTKRGNWLPQGTRCDALKLGAAHGKPLNKLLRQVFEICVLSPWELGRQH